MTALPLNQDSKLELKRASRQRRLIFVALAAVGIGNVSVPINMSAGFPEAIERSGRFCGRGYGDGYHACHSSGMRPLANLPPRTYPSRIGSMDEKINGCPQCGDVCVPGVDPIRSPAPDTFYHRFDQYARSVSHQRMHAEQSMSPFQALVDPEESIAHGYSQLDPQGNAPEYRNNVARRYPSINEPTVAATGNQEDESIDAPRMTEEEMVEYREYLEQKRLREKFDKYLIDPADTEPKQIMGGPPVGTETRRRIDEAKVRKIQERLRRELADEAEAKRQAERQAAMASENSLDRFQEDSLPSSSDRRVPSTLDDLPIESPRSDRERFDSSSTASPDLEAEAMDAMGMDDELPMPLDELLPPYPGESQLPPTRSPFPETIPQGPRESLENFNSRKPTPTQQTRRWIQQPSDRTHQLAQERIVQPSDRMDTTQTHTSEELTPAHRVATLPRNNEIPESWHFVKQPE